MAPEAAAARSRRTGSGDDGPEVLACPLPPPQAATARPAVQLPARPQHCGMCFSSMTFRGSPEAGLRLTKQTLARWFTPFTGNILSSSHLSSLLREWDLDPGASALDVEVFARPAPRSREPLRDGARVSQEAAEPAAIDSAGIRSARAEPASARGRGRGVVALLGLCGLSASLVQTLVVPLLPGLPAILGVSPPVTPWLVTVTLLTGAIATPLLARLGDTYGRRRLLLLSLALLAIGSIVCALPLGFVGLLIGRAVQGAALATIPLSISIANTLPVVRRPNAAIALISAMMGVGGAIGLPAAGLIADHWGFRWLFLLLAAVATAATIGTALVVPPIAGRREARLDVLGTVLFALVLAALLLALTNANRWGWASPLTLGLLALCAAMTPIFLVVETRHSAPIVDIRAAIQRPVLLTNIAAFFTGFTMFENFVTTLALAQVPASSGHGFGLSAAAASLCLLPTGLVMVLISPVTGRLLDRFRGRATMLIGLGLLFLGCTLRLLGSSSVVLVMTSSAVIGLGTALSFAAMPAMILAVTPTRQSSAAVGLNALSRSLGAAGASALSGVVLAGLTVARGRAGPSFPTGLRPLVAGGRSRGDLCKCGRGLCATCPPDHRLTGPGLKRVRVEHVTCLLPSHPIAWLQHPREHGQPMHTRGTCDRRRPGPGAATSPEFRDRASLTRCPVLETKQAGRQGREAPASPKRCGGSASSVSGIVGRGGSDRHAESDHW